MLEQKRPEKSYESRNLLRIRAEFIHYSTIFGTDHMRPAYSLLSPTDVSMAHPQYAGMSLVLAGLHHKALHTSAEDISVGKRPLFTHSLEVAAIAGHRSIKI